MVFVSTPTNTTYFVSIELLDRTAVRAETNLDLDPTMPGVVKAEAFWAQRLQGRYGFPKGPAFTISIEAAAPEIAAEVAYEIFNSYPANPAEHLPAELHFDAEANPQYLGYLKRWRGQGNRSLSKGDIVRVRATTDDGPTMDLGVNGWGMTVLTNTGF